MQVENREIINHLGYGAPKTLPKIWEALRKFEPFRVPLDKQTGFVSFVWDEHETVLLVVDEYTLILKGSNGKGEIFKFPEEMDQIISKLNALPSHSERLVEQIVSETAPGSGKAEIYGVTFTTEQLTKILDHIKPSNFEKASEDLITQLEKCLPNISLEELQEYIDKGIKLETIVKETHLVLYFIEQDMIKHVSLLVNSNDATATLDFDKTFKSFKRSPRRYKPTFKVIFIKLLQSSAYDSLYKRRPALRRFVDDLAWNKAPQATIYNHLPLEHAKVLVEFFPDFVNIVELAEEAAKISNYELLEYLLPKITSPKASGIFGFLLQGLCNAKGSKVRQNFATCLKLYQKYNV